MIHMILCCGIPVIIILSLPFIANFSPAIAAMLAVIAPFICPIMMGGMMFMMFSGKKKKCCPDNSSSDNSISEIESK